MGRVLVAGKRDTRAAHVISLSPPTSLSNPPFCPFHHVHATAPTFLRRPRGQSATKTLRGKENFFSPVTSYQGRRALLGDFETIRSVKSDCDGGLRRFLDMEFTRRVRVI